MICREVWGEKIRMCGPSAAQVQHFKRNRQHGSIAERMGELGSKGKEPQTTTKGFQDWYYQEPDDGGIEIEMTAHFRKERRPIATEFQSILFDTCTRSSRNTRSTRIKDLGDASAHFSASINRKGLFYTTHLSRNPLIFASQNHRAVSRYMYQSTR